MKNNNKQPTTEGLQHFYTTNSAEVIANHILTQDETTIQKNIIYYQSFREQMALKEKVNFYEDNLRLGWLSTTLTAALGFGFAHFWGDEILELITKKKEAFYSFCVCVPFAFFNMLNGARLILKFRDFFKVKKEEKQHDNANHKEEQKTTDSTR